MFDPDAGHRPTLRLDAPPRKDPHAERAEIRQQIDALWVRYCDLVMESDTEVAQSRPISAQRQPTERTNAQHLARYDQSDPLWRLHMGEHDTRVHQHAPRYDQARVMGGHHAKVARVDGSLDAPL